MREEIIKKSNELGQHYFPNECSVWARPNIEAMYVTSACQEMAEWMIDKVCEWLSDHSEDITCKSVGLYGCKAVMSEDLINNLRKAMEE